MRTKNSVYNIASNYIIFFVKTILTFWVRSVLISKISQNYIGLNGLFANILSVLSLAELGLSSAIGFGLYKPLIENDIEKISALMTFFKEMYKKIGTIIFSLGLLIIPFLSFVVKEKIEGMYLIYFLFLINTCSLYFISYKDILISSDQKNYKLTRINLLFTVLINVAQLIVLYIANNYILYLLAQFLVSILQRIVVNIYIGMQYPRINFSSNLPLEEKAKKELNTNIKAMCYHKIGDCMINATDNIIISIFISLNAVSVYSNYLLVTSYLNTFVNMIYAGILASVGNFLVTENEERKKELFEFTNFIGFTIFSISTVILMNVFNPFIEILANKDYVLPIETVILVVLNFYITGMRVPVNNIKNAAGVFDVDKYTPLIQAVINIIVSVALARVMGITGVLIGTLISSILPSIQRPCIVYKYVLKQRVGEYFAKYLVYFVFTVLVTVLTMSVNHNLNYPNEITQLLANGIITFAIYFFIYICVFGKSKVFVSLKKRFFKMIGERN